MNMRASRMIMC